MIINHFLLCWCNHFVLFSHLKVILYNLFFVLLLNLVKLKLKNIGLIKCVFKFQTMTDVVGNPEEERKAEFYNQPWTEEAVKRYIYFKAQQKQTEHQLDIHSS